MSSIKKPTLSEIKTSIKTIKTIIKNIELKGITTPADKEDYFWKNHPEMMNRFAFLISQLCTDINSPMLNIMLAQLEQVEKGQSLDDADKQIGQKLASVYLPTK
jgi:hypothetical protein